MRKNTGLPKNEGYTRNFLGRGDAAKQAIEFYYYKIRSKQSVRKNTGFPKNEGYPRNFLGRGSVTLHLFPNEFDYHLNRAARIFDKFRASKACIDDDYLYSLYKSLIVAYTKSGVIPNFSKSSFVPSPLRTNTEFIPAFFPQAMSV